MEMVQSQHPGGKRNQPVNRGDYELIRDAITASRPQRYRLA